MRKKRRRSKRGSGMPIVFAVLALLMIAAFVLFRFVFVVRNVDTTGSFSLSREEITRAAGIRFNGSIFRVDTDAIARNVNALGTVGVDDVQLVYPSTVRIQAHDRIKQAMFVFSSGVTVLDEEGFAVARMMEVPNEDLLYISGLHARECRVGERVDAQEGQIEAYSTVVQALNRNSVKSYASELNLDDVNNMYILTRNGITVLLGNADNMYNKIAWMKGAILDLEARKQYGGTLDVQSGTKADYTARTAAASAGN